MIDLGGFEISFAQRNSMVLVVVLYSVVIVGLGLWVKRASAGDKANPLASYLTGGGGLNAFEIAMFTVTSALAGGTMVGGPGLSYGFGFVSIVAVYCGFAMNLTILGTIGKKTAIVGHRIGALTPLQLLRHRYQSKALVYVLGAGFILFGTAQAASNLMIAAKLFTAITGISSYLTGLLLATVAIVIYTLSGGIKSLARICVIQGVLMVSVVVLLCFRQYDAVFRQFGSVQSAMESVGSLNPMLLQAQTWTPLYAFGLSLCYGWTMFALPVAIQGNLTYNSSRKLARAIVISLACTTVLHFAMTGSAVFTYALNPNLAQPDYSVVYLATSLLPSGIAGFAVAGCFAAVQSTVATVLLLIAAAITKDIYKDCIKPEMDDRTVAKLNYMVLVLLSAVAVAIGMFPTTFTQLLNTFASAGITIVFIMPLLFGLYWRRATRAGALASSLGGLFSYIGFWLLSRYTPDFWLGIGNPNPVFPALVTAFVLMISVSMFTKKAPLGVCKVWFSSDYEEKYCREYDLR